MIIEICFKNPFKRKNHRISREEVIAQARDAISRYRAGELMKEIPKDQAKQASREANKSIPIWKE